jgi:hypothetical protein
LTRPNHKHPTVADVATAFENHANFAVNKVREELSTLSTDIAADRGNLSHAPKALATIAAFTRVAEELSNISKAMHAYAVAGPKDVRTKHAAADMQYTDFLEVLTDMRNGGDGLAQQSVFRLADRSLSLTMESAKIAGLFTYEALFVHLDDDQRTPFRRPRTVPAKTADVAQP